MMSFKAVAGLSVLSQALALPTFYDMRKMGCTIPEEAFGGHSAPTVDATITFTLTDAAGAAVTAWEAGGEYTVTVSSYDGADATNTWIHSTGGTLGGAYDLAACGDAVYSSVPVATHEVSWTAPMDTSACITVSSAQAASPITGYATNMATLCAAGAAPATAEPMGATPMATTPMPEMVGTPAAPTPAPEAGEAGEDGEVEETVEAATEGAEDTAEGAGEAVEEGTSGAAGVAGAVTAVVAAAVAVLAA